MHTHTTKHPTYVSYYPFTCVELDSEPSRVPEGLWGASLMNDSGKSDNDWCLNARGPEDISTGEVGDIMCDLYNRAAVSTA